MLTNYMIGNDLFFKMPIAGPWLIGRGRRVDWRTGHRVSGQAGEKPVSRGLFCLATCLVRIATCLFGG